MRYIRGLWIVLVCFFASAAWGGEAIPFQFAQGLIWVKVVSAGAPLHFVLDSGAGSSAISLETAQRLGIRLGAGLPVLGASGRAAGYHVSHFDGAIGSVPIRANIIAMDLRSISAACGKHIDGIIGQDFFRGRIVQINFRSHCVEILEHVSPTHASAVLPLRYRGDTMCVPVGVNGAKPQWTRLDTGCTSSLEWAATDAGSRRTFSTAALSLTKGGSCCRTSADVQLGNETLHNVTIGLHARQMFAGEAGLLGAGILSRYCITIDGRSMKLYLDKR